MKPVTIVGGSKVYANVVKSVLQKACRTVRYPKEMEVAVVFVVDAKMRELNRKYRGKDRTTNVLSFSTHDSYFMIHASQNDLGDIFISLPEAKREAKQYGWSMRYEIARLALHGFLHLLGYNHVKDKEARVMERVEKKVLVNF